MADQPTDAANISQHIKNKKEAVPSGTASFCYFKMMYSA